MPSLSQIVSILAVVTYAHVASCAPMPLPEATEAGDAYSGEGGVANGGTVFNPSNKGLLCGIKLISAFSHNAGSGGIASSGNAVAGSDSSSTTDDGNNSDSSSGGTNVLNSAYTGKGGSASGGDIVGDECGGLIDLFSGNAGKGGIAPSGNAGSNPPAQAQAQAKGGVEGKMAKAPMSPALPLLRIIRARMDMD